MKSETKWLAGLATVTALGWGTIVVVDETGLLYSPGPPLPVVTYAGRADSHAAQGVRQCIDTGDQCEHYPTYKKQIFSVVVSDQYEKCNGGLRTEYLKGYCDGSAENETQQNGIHDRATRVLLDGRSRDPRADVAGRPGVGGPARTALP